MSSSFVIIIHVSFRRVMPLGAKHGQLLFKITTRESFSSFVDVDSVVISMLFDSKLTVPDALSARQLKQRKRAVAANPFTTAEQRKKARAIGTKEVQVWEPIEVSTKAPGAGSAASMCTASGRKLAAPATPPIRPMSLPSPAKVMCCVAFYVVHIFCIYSFHSCIFLESWPSSKPATVASVR